MENIHYSRMVRITWIPAFRKRATKLLSQVKGKKITPTQYRNLRDQLAETQATYVEERALAREGALLMRKEFARLARIEKRENVVLRRGVLFHGEIADDIDLHALWTSLPEGPSRFISNDTTSEDDLHNDRIHDAVHVKDDKYKRFRSWVIHQWLGMDSAIVGFTLIVSGVNTVPAQRMIQAYRDGVNHCVFTPILKKLEESLEGATNAVNRKRIINRIKDTRVYETLYASGVPEDKMEEIAKKACCKITLYDILGREIAVYNEKCRTNPIALTNTRENHVDGGHITSDICVTEVTEQELRQVASQLRRDGQFYLSFGKGTSIDTLHGRYTVHNPDKIYFEQFEEEYGFNKYKLDAIKYPDVNTFLKEACTVNSWPVQLSTDEPTGHIDCTKAYAQFRKCSYYQGFLGMIHQWRKGPFDRAFITKHIGCYRFTVHKTARLMERLGMREGTYTLPSPEILYFMDLGAEISIHAGVWGSSFEFDFPDYMLQKRRYALWSGKQSMENDSDIFTFPASREWAEHLACDYDAQYDISDNTCVIRRPASRVRTNHHILAFITSYLRITMMQTMSLFQEHQITGVVMDAIYYTGTCPEVPDIFRDKPMKPMTASLSSWYHESTDVDWPEMWCSGNTLLTGQGGSGKTYKVMTDTGFNKVLYVSPCNILGQDVRKKYDCTYTTIHKLLGAECRSFKEDKFYPAVILVDELTQIDAGWIDAVFEMYPESLILLSGDVDEKQWYQCRGGYGSMFSEIWKPSIDIYEVVGDRRSRDDQLKQVKIDIRAEMQRVFIDGDTIENERMKEWVRSKLSPVSFDFAVGEWKPGDIWIAGTHRTNQRLLDAGVVSGYYKRGGYVADVETEGYDKRGSFTTHSIQGRTIETGRIFVYIDDAFEYAMIYTALSRAVNWSQLCFVTG